MKIGYKLFIRTISICILGFLFFNLSGQVITTDTLKPGIGKQVKGMYVGGGIFAAGGAALGAFANGFSGGNKNGALPFHTAVWASVPGSLIGLGFGAASKKLPSPVRKSFQVSFGLALSSAFSGNNADSGKSGVYLRFLTPELGNWRYSFGFNQYFSQEFMGFNQTFTEFNIDLQYMLYLDDLMIIYPFIGNNYLIRTSSAINTGSQYDGTTLDDAGVNYGLGINVLLSPRWNILGEIRFTISQGEDNWTAYNFGVQYYLK
jgi:hypothetical protein